MSRRASLHRGIAMGGAVVVAGLAFAWFGAGGAHPAPVPAGGGDRYWRTQAVLQAYAMAERIAANPQGAAAGAYDRMREAGVESRCARSGCPPEGIAANDFIEWNAANAALLPSGSGTIAREGDALVITVRWDPSLDGESRTSCDAGESAAWSCYRLRLRR